MDRNRKDVDENKDVDKDVIGRVFIEGPKITGSRTNDILPVHIDKANIREGVREDNCLGKGRACACTRAR